jgi:hypothetical protein
LLKGFLTEEQARCWDEKQGFWVDAGLDWGGEHYISGLGLMSVIRRIGGWKFCLQPSISAPAADACLTRLMLLLHAPDEFYARANVIW